MKFLKYLTLALVAAGSLTVAGCKEEGPLEKAGKDADKAMKDAGKATQDAADKAKAALEKK